MLSIKNNVIKMDNKTSSIVISTENKLVQLLYLGERIKEYSGSYLNTVDKGHVSIDDTTFYSSLLSFNGDGNNRESAILLRGKNNEITHRFVFDSLSTVDDYKNDPAIPHARNKKDTVCFTYKCVNADVTVNQYISSFDNCDAFVFWTQVINNGNETISVNRLMSMQLDLYSSKDTIYTLDGAWMRERHLNKHSLNTGVFFIDSKSGVSSNTHNPYFYIESQKHGYIACNLIYSGNHKEIVEKTEMGRMRILTGMNDYTLNYPLETGEEFTSPEAVVVVGQSAQEITTKMHEFVTENIIPSRFKNMDRPILINNWEGTFFDFTQEKLLQIADRASQMGVELFVLDDGWFGKRNNDDCALGDWFDNKEKTGGLSNLKKEMAKRGLKFGFWIEPEMICKESNLYKNHPEYAMAIPNVSPIEKRNQLMLDLTNDDAINNVLNQLYSIIDEVEPDYIKWDYNRTITDAYSVCVNQGKFYDAYIKGVYKMFNSLMTRYPNVLFEGCSAGGNRFDLGILYYAPQIWCSDDTDARERIYIQEGTLYAYPQSTIGAHVTISPNHGTQNATSPDDRFNVASLGAFGYELDLCKISDDELELYKKQVEFYKQNRHLLQFGDYYRINNLFEEDNGGWVIVSKDKSTAIAMLVQTKYSPDREFATFALKGLCKDKKYNVSMRVQGQDSIINSFDAYGDVLMSGQIIYGDFFWQADRSKYSNSIASRLLVIKEIK